MLFGAATVVWPWLLRPSSRSWRGGGWSRGDLARYNAWSVESLLSLVFVCSNTDRGFGLETATCNLPGLIDGNLYIPSGEM